MKDTITHKITSDTFDTKLGQAVCFITSVLVLVLSMWKLTRLDLSESQLFFGVLLSGCVPLLCVVVGLLLPIARAERKSKT
jgi:hypothetical protein